jgi:hypothetical protein
MGKLTFPYLMYLYVNESEANDPPLTLSPLDNLIP